jgi:tetratricopeptide (TPR) repeat protein
MGRFSIAAKHHQSIAEMYEGEANDLVSPLTWKKCRGKINKFSHRFSFVSPSQHRAVQHYEQAADYFKGEESTSSANKCMLKVAQYAAQLEDYEKAIQIYESVAGSCLDSSLLKYSAKEYFFRAALCHLSVDLLNAQHALEKYAQQYPAFQDSREFKLIKVSEKVYKNTENVHSILLLCPNWLFCMVNFKNGLCLYYVPFSFVLNAGLRNKTESGTPKNSKSIKNVHLFLVGTFLANRIEIKNTRNICKVSKEARAFVWRGSTLHSPRPLQFFPDNKPAIFSSNLSLKSQNRLFKISSRTGSIDIQLREFFRI